MLSQTQFSLRKSESFVWIVVLKLPLNVHCVSFFSFNWWTLYHQHVREALPPVERLSGEYQKCFWKLERGQRLCWCDSGLWGWPAGGSTQGDIGFLQSLLSKVDRKKQPLAPTHLRGEWEFPLFIVTLTMMMITSRMIRTMTKPLWRYMMLMITSVWVGKALGRKVDGRPWSGWTPHCCGEPEVLSHGNLNI